jgi:carbamoyltransferase
MFYTLGISAFYHDSAAVLLCNDQIIAAFQEERFTRIKQDKSFPINAIKQCLNQSNISFKDINLICYYEDPDKKFNRIIKTYLRNFPKRFLSLAVSLPRYVNNKNIVNIIKKNLKKEFGIVHQEILLAEHHLSHAASTFYPSPFDEAAILCMDGVGEWATTSAWIGNQVGIEPLWQIDFPHSLGLLYSAFTYFCGFKVDSGEYKLMGLAPYGKPKYEDIILQNLITLHDDATFTLNRKYFDYEVGDSMISPLFEDLFSGKRRLPESKITQREMDMAASIQSITERIVIKLAQRLQQETQQAHLCLAGGVALNCVANGKLLKSKIFEDIWIQPASGDAGGALGSAYIGYHHKNPPVSRMPSKRGRDKMHGAYLGNEYNDEEIKDILDQHNAKYIHLDDEQILMKTAQVLQNGNIVGWFQGRMEFGPRALGNRSILGDPRIENMQSRMNLKIKNRESFRPFAPAILEEHVSDWFNLDRKSPYMLLVTEVHDSQKLTETNDLTDVLVGLDQLKIPRSKISAITHIDFSARVQTVSKETNPKFYELLQKFYQLTNCPILINTSFNVRGEPIVEGPFHAYQCFMRTAMDYLIVGNYFLDKKLQPNWIEQCDWREVYALD